MAAPSFVNSQNWSNGSGATSASVTAPASIVADNLLVAEVNADGNVSPNTVNTPTGWTALRHDTSGSGNNSSWLFYKIATGSEPASYSWTSTGFNMYAIGIAQYSGNATTSPIETSSGANGTTGTTMTAASVTTTTDQDLVLAIYAAWTSSAMTSGPSGYSAEFNYGGGGGDIAAFYDKAISPAGATGSVSAVQGTSGPWVAQLIAIKPAAGGGGGVVAPPPMRTLRGFGI